MLDFSPYATTYLNRIFKNNELHVLNFYLDKLAQNYYIRDNIVIFDGIKIEENFEKFLNRDFLNSNITKLEISLNEIRKAPTVEKKSQHSIKLMKMTQIQF